MGYVLKEVKDNFKRYKFANQICIWSITMTMLIIGIFLLFAVNLKKVINELKESVEIVAFLKNKIDSRQLAQLKEKITAIPNVKSVQYISPEDALVDFTRDSDLRKQIEFIGENPLPASFNIKLNVESEVVMTAVVKEIEKYDQIDEVRYGKEEVNNLTAFSDTVKFGGIIIFIIMGIMTVTVIGYTIFLAISLRGQEIRVMKLVGASPWFIRTPFMVEGILHGCAGGLLATGLLYVVYKIVMIKLAGIIFLPVFHILVIVAAGMLIGLAGNLAGIENHLRESNK
jgi:cell division transport system permease protein